MIPEAALLDRLSRARLIMHHARATVGTGDRQSNQKGPGVDFASYRPFQEGDDIRKVDPRVLARLGDRYVREHYADRQLPVYVLVDFSKSMAAGRPGKLDCARYLANILAFIALASGDRVQYVVDQGRDCVLSPRFQGKNRAAEMFNWLAHQRPTSSRPVSALLARASALIPQRAMVIVVSDFLDESAPEALRLLRGRQQQVLALHIASREEIDPSHLPGGMAVLTDSESEQSIEISLEAGTIARYREAFTQWCETVESALTSIQGRYLFCPTDRNFAAQVEQDLRRAGVVG